MLSEHFSVRELTKSSTASRLGINNKPSDTIIVNLRVVCERILEPIRANYGVPITPSSGYRSKELNRKVGGSKSSQHCKGEAVDIEVDGVDNYDLALWVSENIEFDQLIMECYTLGEHNSGWVHISVKKDPSLNRGEVLTYSEGAYYKGLLK